MIISDKYRFAFVHIPKCAGTTVRHALTPFDDASERYYDKAVSVHPAFGPLDHPHVPLAVLKEYFPADFDRLERYASFALFRDPFARFSSSLHERIVQREKRPLHEVGIGDAAREIDKVLKELAAFPENIPITDPEMIHFSRQKDYVFLGDQRVVKSLRNTKDVNELLDEISQIVGEPIVTDGAKNQRVHYSLPALGKWQKAVTRPIEKALPRKLWKPVFNTIKTGFLATGIMRHGANLLDELPNRDEINGFISEFYAQDIQLFAKVNATHPSASLASGGKS